MEAMQAPTLLPIPFGSIALFCLSTAIRSVQQKSSMDRSGRIALGMIAAAVGLCGIFLLGQMKTSQIEMRMTPAEDMAVDKDDLLAELSGWENLTAWSQLAAAVTGVCGVIIAVSAVTSPDTAVLNESGEKAMGLNPNVGTLPCPACGKPIPYFARNCIYCRTPLRLGWSTKRDSDEHQTETA